MEPKQKWNRVPRPHQKVIYKRFLERNMVWTRKPKAEETIPHQKILLKSTFPYLPHHTMNKMGEGGKLKKNILPRIPICAFNPLDYHFKGWESYLQWSCVTNTRQSQQSFVFHSPPPSPSHTHTLPSLGGNLFLRPSLPKEKHFKLHNFFTSRSYNL